MAANTMIKGGRAAHQAHLVPAPTFDRYTAEWKPRPHLRQAELDRLPAPISMTGKIGAEGRQDFWRGW